MLSMIYEFIDNFLCVIFYLYLELKILKYEVLIL